MLNGGTLHSLGVIAILVGVIVLIIAFAILLLSSFRDGRVRGGGALIIGPVPIVFGTDKETVRAVLWLSIVLTMIAFALFLTLYLLGR